MKISSSRILFVGLALLVVGTLHGETIPFSIQLHINRATQSLKNNANNNQPGYGLSVGYQFLDTAKNTTRIKGNIRLILDKFDNDKAISSLSQSVAIEGRISPVRESRYFLLIAPLLQRYQLNATPGTKKTYTSLGGQIGIGRVFESRIAHSIEFTYHIRNQANNSNSSMFSIGVTWHL